MNQQEHYDFPTKSKRLFTLALKRFSIVMILIIIAALSISTMIAKITGEFSSEKSTSQTVKLRLENIGLLATQSAYCKEVLLVENDRKIGIVAVPFTKSKTIYTYDVTVTAGYNFENINIKQDGTTVTVTLPPVETIDKYIIPSSGKEYLDDQSIFAPISLTRINKEMSSLVDQSEADAIENGLYEKAFDNAKVILTSFLSNAYPSNYDIVIKASDS